MRPDWTQSKFTPCRFNLSNNICVDPQLIKQLPQIDHNHLCLYPDEYPIYQSLDKLHQVSMSQIAIGLGLGELIQRIYLHIDVGTVTVVTPTWPMSHVFLTIEHIPYRCVNYHNFDQLDFELLTKPPTDSIYISNPNGVNSHVFSKDQIAQLLGVYRWVIVDESYMEFSKHQHSMIDQIGQHKNLLILKTLSKSLSMPGLRLGYALSHADVIQQLQLCRPSCVAHGVTVQLIEHAVRLIPEHVSRMLDTRRYIEERYNTISSNGNYVLFRGSAPVQPDVLTKAVAPGITRMSLFAPELIPSILA